MTRFYYLKNKATFLIVFGCLVLSAALQAQDVTPSDTVKHIPCITPAVADTVNQVQNFMTDNTDTTAVSNSATLYPDFSDSIYALRIQAIQSAVPLTYNDQVSGFIHLYVFRKRELLERMLGVSQVYFPIFEKILRDNNLPSELKYLPVIESALNPEAVSRCGAVGMWQFMYSTGKLYGLKINRDIDERRDIYKSSEAAAAYLKASYEKYGDWLLAIASYNCGPGNIDKAIWRSGGKTNFWEIIRFLPKETRSYISAFIGAMYVMNYYPYHNLNPQYPDNKFCEISCVPVTSKICLEKIAQYSNCSVDDIKFLNPGLNSNVIPAFDDEPYMLKLPAQMMAVYDSMKDSIVLSSADVEPQYRARYMYGVGNIHTVRKGETLASIAKKYHVSPVLIKHWNHLKGSTVRTGQKIKLYGGVGEKAYASASGKSKASKSSHHHKSTTTTVASGGNKVVYYKVKNGDTLWSIAKRYRGVTVADIKAVNSPYKTSSLRRGTTLKIMLKQVVRA